VMLQQIIDVYNVLLPLLPQGVVCFLRAHRGFLSFYHLLIQVKSSETVLAYMCYNFNYLINSLINVLVKTAFSINNRSSLWKMSIRISANRNNKSKNIMFPFV
jgi:hypothetical protein